ncbi:MAG: hypothetical protein Q9216_007165, partial [Gyalolechia sp. 2 TL-2023]
DGGGEHDDNNDNEGTEGSGNEEASRRQDQDVSDDRENEPGYGGGEEDSPAGTASEESNNGDGNGGSTNEDTDVSQGLEPAGGNEGDGTNSLAATDDSGDNDNGGSTDGGTNEDVNENRDQGPADGNGGQSEVGVSDGTVNVHGEGHGNRPTDPGGDRRSNDDGGTSQIADVDENGSLYQEPGDGHEGGDRNEDGGDGISGIEDGKEAEHDNGDGSEIEQEREHDAGDPSSNDDDGGGAGDNTPERQSIESPSIRGEVTNEKQQQTQPGVTQDSIQQDQGAVDSNTEHGAAGSDPSSSYGGDIQNPSTPKRQSAGTEESSASLSTPAESQSRRHQPTYEDLGPNDQENALPSKSPIRRLLPGPTGLPTPPTSARRQQLTIADTPPRFNPAAASLPGPDHPSPSPEATPSAAPEETRGEREMAASMLIAMGSPTTQQAANANRRFGRPTVRQQSATHNPVNESASGSASDGRVLGQTVIDDPVRIPPDEPLRLGAPHIDHSTLNFTLSQISNLPDIIALSPRHRQTLERFVLSFFMPNEWWSLRNMICKVAALTGYRNTKPLERKQPTPQVGRKKPQCLQDYIDSWHKQRVFCQSTAHPAITRMLRMNGEMHLYVYWSRLVRVWLTTREDYNPDRVGQETSDTGMNNDCLAGEEAEISSDQAAELIQFFEQEVQQRERSLGGWQTMTRSVALLKSLIAPYLGYSFPFEAGATAGRGNATKKMFDTLLSKTNVRGKEYYILRRNLGWGAFAIAKISYLNTLGSRILSQILPIIHTNHPYLREIFAIVYDTFIYPVTWGCLLQYQAVGSFLRIRSKSELIQVCKRHPNGLTGVFESGGRRIPAPFHGEQESTADATGTAAKAAASASTAQDTEMPEEEEEEDVFDIKEFLDQEHAMDLVEDAEYMTPPGSEAKKRTAVVEAAGEVARGLKRREMTQGER